MSGFGFGNVGFVGSLGGAVTAPAANPGLAYVQAQETDGTVFTAAQRTAVLDFFTALTADGTYANLKAGYLFVGTKTTYELEMTTPTGAGAMQAAGTPLTRSAQGAVVPRVKIVNTAALNVNNYSAGLYTTTAAVSDFTAFGAASNEAIFTRYTGNNFAYVFLNNDTLILSPVVTTAAGLSLINSSAAGVAYYRDGASIASVATLQNAWIGAELAINPQGNYAHVIGASFAFSPALTPAQHGPFHTRLAAVMAAFGRVV